MSRVSSVPAHESNVCPSSTRCGAKYPPMPKSLRFPSFSLAPRTATWASTPGQRLCSTPLIGPPKDAYPEGESGASPTSINAACSCISRECAMERSSFAPSCGLQVHKLPDQASGGTATAVRDVGESGLKMGRSNEKYASERVHLSPA